MVVGSDVCSSKLPSTNHGGNGSLFLMSSVMKGWLIVRSFNSSGFAVAFGGQSEWLFGIDVGRHLRLVVGSPETSFIETNPKAKRTVLSMFRE